MFCRRVCGFFLIVLAVIEGTMAATASDWPQWGGSNERNMVSEEKGLPSGFEPGTKRSDGSGIDLKTTSNVKWVSRLGSANYSSPAVANGRLFIGTNDMALED